jgi:hypothetical protein
MMVSDYVASKKMTKFHQSDKFVRGLMGPIGSGKSVASVAEMLMISMRQEPFPRKEKDGRYHRKTRWVIVRNTYRELIDTTIKTFFDWIPEEVGRFKKMDLEFILELPMADGTVLHAEFLFRALDKPKDVKKLLSLEVTGGWVNEAREVPKQIIDMLIGRLGRYPRKIDKKGGATWHGLIMDTNPPDSDSWWYKLFEVDKPHNHAIFVQPSGMSDDAENIDNLPDGYYENMQAGKDKEWINVYVHGKYGFVMDGKPVFPEYKDDVHSTSTELNIDDSLTIYIGIDFGLTPAAVFGVLTSAARWLIIDELVTEDMGAKNFAKLLNRQINKNWSGYNFEIYGDPAGDQRAQTDEITPFQILAAEGVEAVPTYTNDVLLRREAVAGTLSRMDFAGNTGFLLGPRAVMLRKALAGGYKYKRMAVSGQERYMDKPDKGRYSHVADALQYMMLGGGEGGRVVENTKSSKKIDYSDMDDAII